MMNRARVERLLKMKEQALTNSGLQQRALRVALEEAEARLDIMQVESLSALHDSDQHIQTKTARDRISWGAFLDLLGKRRAEQAQVVDELSHAFEEKRRATEMIWRDAKSWGMLAELYAAGQADKEFRLTQKAADDLAAVRHPGQGV